MKNVILLVVDALMPSRTGFGGHCPALSPELDKLAKDGWSCENVFSMGNPTEFALPGLFASSLLLDDGGIASGIGGRPATLAEALRDKGYRTGLFFPVYRPYTHGYERGFDDCFYLYDPNVIGKNFNNIWRWYREKHASGELCEQECIDEMAAVCAAYFDDILKYCAIWQSPVYRAAVPASLIFDRFDFDALARDVGREKRIFDSDRAGYVRRLFAGDPVGPMPLIEREVSTRVNSTPTTLVDIRFRLLFIRNLISMWRASTSYKSAKEVCALAVYRVLQGQHQWIKYPSAGFMVDTFKNWVTANSTNRPFYAYLHLTDVHELSHYSYDIPGSQEEKILEFRLIKRAFQDIRKQRGYKGNMLYDTSIRYVDHVIKRLREFLRDRNLLRDTLLVITSDHGGLYPNIPIRDNIPHRVNCFFDELYRVPLIFSGSNVQGSYSGLVSSVDIAPTILSAVGYPAPASFRGVDIRHGSPRTHVSMENQGRGPSDLGRRPIRVCVRTNDMKLVFEGAPITRAGEGRIAELYDLGSDVGEQVNLAGVETAVARAQSLLGLAQERLEQIREGYQRSVSK